jgi:3-hydroxybutyryl-CoA dehydrogenase
MQIIVLADALQRTELLNNDSPNTGVTWVNDMEEFLNYRDADAFIDLEFINTPERNLFLAQLLPKPVIINCVTDTLPETNVSFIRINAWTSFLSSYLVEASCTNEEAKQKAEKVFSFFNKKIEWLPDQPGFITARVVSMIINEAFIALEEGVSAKEEIDTAMKLGTAYPYGPFEWAEKIGVQNIVLLLKKLSGSRSSYTPSELLVQETDKPI